jgi:hypothetical protein
MVTVKVTLLPGPKSPDDGFATIDRTLAPVGEVLTSSITVAMLLFRNRSFSI